MVMPWLDAPLSTAILGHKHALPFLLTSCAGQRMFHADGEVATAKAAKKHGMQKACAFQGANSQKDSVYRVEALYCSKHEPASEERFKSSLLALGTSSPNPDPCRRRLVLSIHKSSSNMLGP